MIMHLCILNEEYDVSIPRYLQALIQLLTRFIVRLIYRYKCIVQVPIVRCFFFKFYIFDFPPKFFFLSDTHF